MVELDVRELGWMCVGYESRKVRSYVAYLKFTPPCVRGRGFRFWKWGLTLPVCASGTQLRELTHLSNSPRQLLVLHRTKQPHPTPTCLQLRCSPPPPPPPPLALSITGLAKLSSITTAPELVGRRAATRRCDGLDAVMFGPLSHSICSVIPNLRRWICRRSDKLHAGCANQQINKRRIDRVTYVDQITPR